jgi:hypothetical protein
VEWGSEVASTSFGETVHKGERDFLLSKGSWQGESYLSAAGVVGVSGHGRGLLGPMGAEMLVDPERGGNGGFSSSTSVDGG